MWLDDILIALAPPEVQAAQGVSPPRCSLCGTTRTRPLCLAEDGVTVASMCLTCGIYFTEGPMLTAKPYDSGFWPEENRRTRTIETDDRTHERAGHLEKGIGRSVAGLEILEVGAGRGEYTLELVKRRAVVTAIEPDSVMAGRVARQLGILALAGWVDEFQPGERRFDVINLSHVLEHLRDPVATLRRLRGWLKPTGVVALEVPNADVLAHGRLASFFFDETTHRYHFTADSLARIVRAARLDPFALEPAFSNHWGARTAIRALARPGTEAALQTPSSRDLRRALRNPLLQHLAWVLWRRPSRRLRHLVGKVIRRYLPPGWVTRVRAALRDR